MGVQTCVQQVQGLVLTHPAQVGTAAAWQAVVQLQLQSHHSQVSCCSTGCGL